MGEENEDILVSVENGVGLLTLNRPKAINSLNDVMVAGLAKALDGWEYDDSVHTVLLTGAGERGLCAGGDVVAIYHDAKSGGSQSRTFWHDEYVLNAHIARYPKPYVAVMDGIVKENSATPSQVALAWVLKRSPVMLPIPGTGSVDHLEDNVQAADIKLSDADFAALDAQAKAASSS